MRCSLALTLFSLALVETRAQVAQRTSDVLFTARNSKYHLTCAFHGAKVKVASGFQNDVKSVTVSDERTGQTARFKPLDMAALESALLFSDDVWSPDEEWLVLPLGQSEGFQLIRARTALAQLRGKGVGEFIRLDGFERTHLAQTFSGWSPPASFHIRVEGEERGKHWQYLFNLNDFSVQQESEGTGIVDSFATSKGKSEFHGKSSSHPRP